MMTIGEALARLRARDYHGLVRAGGEGLVCHCHDGRLKPSLEGLALLDRYARIDRENRRLRLVGWLVGGLAFLALASVVYGLAVGVPAIRALESAGVQ